MQLVDVYGVSNSLRILYDLLTERDDIRNIPSIDRYGEYIATQPYLEWFLIIADDGFAVGQVYLTRRYDLGVQVYKEVRNRGYGKFAVHSMIIRHPDRRLSAIIDPDSKESVALFSHFGFEFKKVVLVRAPKVYEKTS